MSNSFRRILTTKDLKRFAEITDSALHVRVVEGTITSEDVDVFVMALEDGELYHWSGLLEVPSSDELTVRVSVQRPFRTRIKVSSDQNVLVQLYEDALFSTTAPWESGQNRNRGGESTAVAPGPYFDPGATWSAGELLSSVLASPVADLGEWELSNQGEASLEYALRITNLTGTGTSTTVEIDYIDPSNP